MELMQASHQWSSRPDDERFTSLHTMGAMFHHLDSISRGTVVSSRSLEFHADEDHKGLSVVGKAGVPYAPSHFSFGQLAALAGAPAGYLRTLPSELAADNLNYGYKVARDVQDVGLYLRKNGGPGMVMAATGPNYGRVRNSEITDALIAKFGDGVTGDFRVPGEFGVGLDRVTKANTTLYASDRDMFVFLADETNRIKIDNRRDGKSGSLARGFFVSNSEVGNGTLSIDTFLFDYVCCNRIVWGATGRETIKIRHTSGAPDRWLHQAMPLIRQMAQAPAAPIEARLAAAQAKKVDDLDAFLKTRKFTSTQVNMTKAAFKADEGRELKDGASLWDIATGVTAYARGIEFQDDRVALERMGGKVLDLVAA